MHSQKDTVYMLYTCSSAWVPTTALDVIQQDAVLSIPSPELCGGDGIREYLTIREARIYDSNLLTPKIVPCFKSF